MEHNAQIPSIDYRKKEFNSLRIESVTEQLRQICFSGYTNILEIGIGNGFLRHCLSFFPQVKLITADIAEELKPDYVCSVLEMPFKDKQFDVVLCGEVLEHLRFEEFLPALKEIKRVAVHRVIISLPDVTRRFGIEIYLPCLGGLRFYWNQLRRHYAKKEYKFNGEHYWEIGYKNSLPKDVVGKFDAAGLTIEKQFRLTNNPWHHFYILKLN